MSDSTRTDRNEIAFVDGGLEDLSTLLAGLAPELEVILLDERSDGVVQMAQALAGRSGVDAIHVISHGAPGMIRLGAALLSDDTLDDYKAEFGAISHALAEGTDLLLYGCSVASGDAGESFLRAVGEGLAADVMASIDDTGANGNWLLEAKWGDIDAEPIFATEGEPIWSRVGHSLAVIVGTDGNDWLVGDVSIETYYGQQIHEDDIIYGRGGDDIIGGLGGNDIVYGEGGSDFLFGGNGNDIVYGGDGDDAIVIEGGNDIIDGGEGNDEVSLADNSTPSDTSFWPVGNATIEGGAGFDVVRVRIIGNLSMVDEFLWFGGGVQRISGVEYLEVWPFNGAFVGLTDFVMDVSRSAIGEIVVEGGGGNDRIVGGLNSLNTLNGGSGDDHITGGNEADSLFGGDGNDAMHGGKGDDVIWADHYELVWADGDWVDLIGESNDVIDGGEGVDTLRLQGNKLAWNVEEIKLSGEKSRFTATRVDNELQKAEFVGVEWLQFDDVKVRVGSIVDTKDLRVELQTGDWEPQDDESFTAHGNAIIGLASQSGNLLRVVGGSYRVSGGQLEVSNGVVYSIGGLRETPLFSGSFHLSLIDPKGAIRATEQSFRLAGLATDLTAMHLLSDGISLTTSFDVPNLLVSRFGVNLENVVIDRNGPRLGTGLTVDLEKFLPPDTPLSLLGKIGVTSEKVELGYSAVDDRLYLKGDVKLLSYPEWKGDQESGSVTKPVLSLSGAEIGIKDGQAYGKGEITSRDFSFAGGWALRNLKFNFDSEKDEYSGSGSLSLPFMKAAGLDSLSGSLLFKANPDFRLDGFFIEGKLVSPGVPIGTTGVFLRSLGGGASNWWSETEPIKWKGSVGLDWLRSVMKLRFETETDFQNSVSGNVKGGILIDDLGIFGSSANPLGAVKFEGAGSLDWSKQHAKLSGEIDILKTIKGTGAIEASGVGQPLITARGTATFKALVVNLEVNGNFTLKYSVDGNSGNDYAAAWAVVENPLYKWGSSLQPELAVGVRVDIDGDFGPDDIRTFGASEVPLYSSWIVDEGVGDLTVFVGWEHEAVGPVQTRVVVYDDLEKTQVREIIAEADYAAHGIAVIDAWSGPTGKVVYIAAPAPGLWDVEVVNPAGLGEVTYSATKSLAENSLSVGAAQATGATIRVDYSVTDLGEGGNLVFFADTDNVGFDGTPIGEMTATQASGQFQWDSAGFTPGQYWLYALFEDGARIPLFDYADNAVNVTARTLGSEDDDHLIGTPGIDTLRGLGGSDILEGRYGDDTLLGGSGNDLLLGGPGSDTHTGGSGADDIGGSLEDLDGDRITDYGLGDAIRVDGVRLDSWTYDAASGAVRLGPETGANAQLNVPVGLDLAKFRLETSAAGSGTPWTRLVYGEDVDGDGIDDSADNALGVANPDQRDTDGDGYGNVVDADLNQDLMVDLIDLSLFEEAFGTESADADFNGDGAVDLFDLSMLDALFGQAPGPSALHPVETSSLADHFSETSQLTTDQDAPIEHGLL
jgi:Ca2+-binding RTX toxin-like protein